MYNAILVLHILFGATCLLSGATAIGAKKGGTLHRRSGSLFYWFMYAVGSSALVMTLMKFNPFLLSIAVFSVYLSFSGKKAIGYWRLREAYTPVLRDRMPCYIAAVTALFMIGYPVALMVRDHKFFVPVLAIFGLILFPLSVRDVMTYTKPEKFVPHNREWLFMHIGKMSGAFISTFTAFLLNNIQMEPFWVPWLAPAAIGLPLIFYAIMQWKRKLNKGKTMSQQHHVN